MSFRSRAFLFLASAAVSAVGACLSSDDEAAPAAAADAGSDATTTADTGNVPDAARDVAADDVAAPDATDAGSDAESHHVCTGIGVTGTPPNCMLFAQCGHGEFTLDCRDAGSACSCDTPDGGTAIVPYDPKLCDITDASDVPAALKLALDTAHAACGY